MAIIAGLDLETTGLKWEKGDKIIEIAISLYRLEDRVKMGHYVRRIYPDRTIHPEAQAVHRISLDDLVGMPLFHQVAGEVRTVIKKCDLVVAHNGLNFDRPFLDAEMKCAGISDWKESEPPWFDTKHCRWATTMGKTPRLKELAFALDVEYDESKAHGALYDVEVMMECLWRGIDYGFINLPTKGVLAA